MQKGCLCNQDIQPDGAGKKGRKKEKSALNLGVFHTIHRFFHRRKGKERGMAVYILVYISDFDRLRLFRDFFPLHNLTKAFFEPLKIVLDRNIFL